MEAREVAGDFGRIEEATVGPLHGGDGVVGEGGGVENGADAGRAGFGEILEGDGEILVGGELVEERAAWYLGVGGTVRTEENGLKAAGGECFGQKRTDFAGGEVGHAAHLVDRGGSGSGGDDGKHERKMPSVMA